MLSVLLGALLLTSSPMNSDTSVTMEVQLVDEGWMPVPGVQVGMQVVRSCSARESDPKNAIDRDTNAEGRAVFDVSPPGSYELLVRARGGFRSARKCIRLFQRVPTQPRVYVQMSLRVDMRQR